MRRPFYAAPEVSSSGRASRASDIFSYGVLMWEAFVCKPPWIKRADGGYAGNPMFPAFPRNAPRRYVALAARCVVPGRADPHCSVRAVVRRPCLWASAAQPNPALEEPASLPAP